MDKEITDSQIYESIRKNVKKILVVDDILYVTKSISRILQNQGYLVFTAMTGKEAIEKFTKHVPDLITVDQKLPDMTGFQLVEKVRHLDGGAETKVIFISAVHIKEEIKSILELGIDNYILKPFKKEKLIASVQKLLAQKKD